MSEEKEELKNDKQTEVVYWNSYLMIGNPGIGKSTLLNGLIGRSEFKSGFSTTGVTSTLKIWDDGNGNYYMDTPGLADIDKKREAASEIEKAFRKGGFFRVFFVVRTTSGRIVEEDMTTMKLVHDAVQEIGTNYAIIVNSVTTGTREKLEKHIAEFHVKCNTGLPGTDHVYIYPFDATLDAASDKIPSLSDEFKKFVNGCPGVLITSEMVKTIQAERFEEIQSNLSKHIKELESTRTLLEAKVMEHQEVLNREKEQRKSLESAFQQQRKELETKLIVEQIERERESTELQKRMRSHSQLMWEEYNEAFSRTQDERCKREAALSVRINAYFEGNGPNSLTEDILNILTVCNKRDELENLRFSRSLFGKKLNQELLAVLPQKIKDRIRAFLSLEIKEFTLTSQELMLGGGDGHLAATGIIISGSSFAVGIICDGAAISALPLVISISLLFWTGVLMAIISVLSLGFWTRSGVVREVAKKATIHLQKDINLREQIKAKAVDALRASFEIYINTLLRELLQSQ